MEAPGIDAPHKQTLAIVTRVKKRKDPDRDDEKEYEAAIYGHHTEDVVGYVTRKRQPRKMVAHMRAGSQLVLNFKHGLGTWIIKDFGPYGWYEGYVVLHGRLPVEGRHPMEGMQFYKIQYTDGDIEWVNGQSMQKLVDNTNKTDIEPIHFSPSEHTSVPRGGVCREAW